VKTVAADGQGIGELAAAIEKHRAFLLEKGLLEKERRERLRGEILERARDLILKRLMRNLEENGVLDQVLDDLVAHRSDPATAAHNLAENSA
jgi:LAO/AO transport system kinase